MSRRHLLPGPRSAFAALLALVAVLMALPHDPGGAAHPAMAPHATQPAHPGQVIGDAPQHDPHGTKAADCEAPVSGCCAMTHCQPMNSVTVHDLVRVTAQATSGAGHAVRAFGSDPGIVLPPPRDRSD